MTFGDLQRMNEAPAPMGDKVGPKKAKHTVSDEAIRATEAAVAAGQAAREASGKKSRRKKSEAGE